MSTREKSFDTDIYSDLELLYKQLEEELVQINPGCNTCGSCCNFSTFDHILYTSSIETGFITRNVEVPDFKISDNICPFLKSNQCSIRDFRTLGCRIFYCNPRYQEISHVLYEKYYCRIKKLSIKHRIPWKYQPFLKHLTEFKSKSESISSRKNRYTFLNP